MGGTDAEERKSTEVTLVSVEDSRGCLSATALYQDGEFLYSTRHVPLAAEGLFRLLGTLGDRDLRLGGTWSWGTKSSSPPSGTGTRFPIP